ncbi:uncharacterized protein LOC141907120 [Tubulanus polymorphus]|uniref:uncharacterized protein LOC141907120 n=1 Tax=Tubulanus polymorphus TaxID=672921 RepID=UPI003DA1CC6C
MSAATPTTTGLAEGSQQLAVKQHRDSDTSGHHVAAVTTTTHTNEPENNDDQNIDISRVATDDPVDSDCTTTSTGAGSKTSAERTHDDKTGQQNSTKRSQHECLSPFTKIEQVKVEPNTIPNTTTLPTPFKGFGMYQMDPRYSNLTTEMDASRYQRQTDWWPYQTIAATDCKIQCPPFSTFGVNTGLMLPPRPPLTQLQQQIKRRRIQERMRLSVEQRQELEEIFQEKEYPSTEFMEVFEKKHNVPMRKIRGWFQNRRARERRQLVKTQCHAVKPLHQMLRPAMNMTTLQDLKNSYMYNPRIYNQYYRPLLPNPVYYSPMLPQSYISAQQNRTFSSNTALNYNQYVNFAFMPPVMSAATATATTSEISSTPPEPDSTNGDAALPPPPSSSGNPNHMKEHCSPHYDPLFTIAKETGVLDGMCCGNQAAMSTAIDKPEHASWNEAAYNSTGDGSSYYNHYGYYNAKPYPEDLNAYVLDLSMKPSPRNNGSRDESDDVDVNNNRFASTPSIVGIQPLSAEMSRPATPRPSLCGNETPAREYFGSLPDEEKCHLYSDILNDDHSEKSRPVTPVLWPGSATSSACLTPSAVSAFHPYNSWRPACAAAPPAAPAHTELGFETPPHYLDIDTHDYPLYEENAQKTLNTPPTVSDNDKQQHSPEKESAANKDD